MPQYKFVKRVNGVAVLCTEWSVPDSTADYNLRRLQLGDNHAKHLGVTWEKVDVGEQIEVQPLFKDTKFWFGKLVTGHEPIRTKPNKVEPKRILGKPTSTPIQIQDTASADLAEFVRSVLDKESTR